MKTTISQLSQILQQLFIEDANQIGSKSEFIQRQRKLSGASFAQSLIFGWQANPKASLEELCQSARVCGVETFRLNNPQANQFLHQLLLKGASYLVRNHRERDDLLTFFRGVYIQDSSQIELPSCLHTIWQDPKTEQAMLKVQAVLDYQHGLFDLTPASGREHDCPLQTVPSYGQLKISRFGLFQSEGF